MKELLEKFQCEEWKHPPYSPDFVLCGPTKEVLIDEGEDHEKCIEKVPSKKKKSKTVFIRTESEGMDQGSN